MFRHRKSYVFFALALVVIVLCGGLAHALVPHSHGNGDDHSGGAGESIIWQMLHGALQHNDKKALFTLVEPLELFVWAIISVLALNAVGSILYTRDFSEPRVNDGRMSALRRGVFRYRVFG